MGTASTKREKSEKLDAEGQKRDVLKLYLDEQNTQDLVEAVNIAVAEAANGRGRVNITIHTGKKATEGGRIFDSSFLFVKATQEAPSQSRGTSSQTPRTFAPKKPVAKTVT